MNIEFGALIIVLLTTIIFYIKDPKAYKWWEFFIPLFVVFGTTLLLKIMIEHSSVKYDEYWGETDFEIKTLSASFLMYSYSPIKVES